MKNIIFDVGDVLLEYRWKDMLVQDYGMTEERAVQIGKSMFDDPLWSGLDLGNPLEETICRYEKKYPEYAKEIRWFLTHGEYMHVKRPEVWEKVHELKKSRIWYLSTIKLFGGFIYETHKRSLFFE